MGYRCDIKANAVIKESDVEDIIDNLPNKYTGIMPYTRKQSWGFPVVCDVHLPCKNVLTVSGSYSISGMYAEEFVDYLNRQLDVKGYITEVVWED